MKTTILSYSNIDPLLEMCKNWTGLKKAHIKVIVDYLEYIGLDILQHAFISVKVTEISKELILKLANTENKVFFPNVFKSVILSMNLKEWFAFFDRYICNYGDPDIRPLAVQIFYELINGKSVGADKWSDYLESKIPDVISLWIPRCEGHYKRFCANQCKNPVIRLCLCNQLDNELAYTELVIQQSRF